MARRMIFDNTTLVFSIKAEGYLDDNERWVTPEDSSVEAIGDLQPYVPSGKEQINLPAQFSLRNSKMYMTSAQIPTIDDVGHTEAGTTVIEGRTFYVATKMDYSDGRLSTDCIFYILVMQPTKEGSV